MRDEFILNSGYGAACEMIAQSLLVFSQDADPIGAGNRQYLVDPGVVRHRYKHKWRIERNGHKCIRGHPMGVFPMLRRDNGHARRESSRYIRLMEAGKLDFKTMAAKTYSLKDATEAYNVAMNRTVVATNVTPNS